MKLICYKGMHDFYISGILPQVPRFWKSKKLLIWEVVFTNASRYTLLGEEWRDWNKGGGQTFHFFNHFIDSAMWAWRYNPYTGLWDYGAYCHVDNQVVKGTAKTKDADKEILLSVPTKVKTIIYLDTDFDAKKYHFTFDGPGKVAQCSINFTHENRCAKEITANFGGDNRAPSKIIVDIKPTY